MGARRRVYLRLGNVACWGNGNDSFRDGKKCSEELHQLMHDNIIDLKDAKVAVTGLKTDIENNDYCCKQTVF